MQARAGRSNRDGSRRPTHSPLRATRRSTGIGGLTSCAGISRPRRPTAAALRARTAGRQRRERSPPTRVAPRKRTIAARSAAARLSTPRTERLLRRRYSAALVTTPRMCRSRTKPKPPDSHSTTIPAEAGADTDERGGGGMPGARSGGRRGRRARRHGGGGRRRGEASSFTGRRSAGRLGERDDEKMLFADATHAEAEERSRKRERADAADAEDARRARDPDGAAPASRTTRAVDREPAS